AERGPEDRERGSEGSAIAVREAGHQLAQLRGGYLWLSGQSSHGKGQLSPHGSEHRKPSVAAHPSAGARSARTSAIHFRLMFASTWPQPRPSTPLGADPCPRDRGRGRE